MKRLPLNKVQRNDYRSTIFFGQMQACAYFMLADLLRYKLNPFFIFFVCFAFGLFFWHRAWKASKTQE